MQTVKFRRKQTKKEFWQRLGVYIALFIIAKIIIEGFKLVFPVSLISSGNAEFVAYLVVLMILSQLWTFFFGGPKRFTETAHYTTPVGQLVQSDAQPNLEPNKKSEIERNAESKLGELMQKYKTSDINDPRIQTEMKEFLGEIGVTFKTK
ncbi:MAG: hypothetical protein NTX72_05060 [Candidatus Uhrbacteria bacterium]|nr:hypothetical protein [Candidatus Uhrbacteria bacterium]